MWLVTPTLLPVRLLPINKETVQNTLNVQKRQENVRIEMKVNTAESPAELRNKYSGKKYFLLRYEGS